MATPQLALFDEPAAGPAGFTYRADAITASLERSLLEACATLDFRAFEFHGWTGRRRTVSFGWRYDFATESLAEAAPIPDFLLPAREAAAAVAGVPAPSLVQALVTEYEAGAGIGWHRDKAIFGIVVGLSLLAPCRFRLRRPDPAMPTRWERLAITAAARSVYVLDGDARREWEHSVPPVEARRYSITFRTLRGARR
jgi:alkylated DNA repair dioxygenase AlkB